MLFKACSLANLIGALFSPKYTISGKEWALGNALKDEQ